MPNKHSSRQVQYWAKWPNTSEKASGLGAILGPDTLKFLVAPLQKAFNAD